MLQTVATFKYGSYNKIRLVENNKEYKQKFPRSRGPPYCARRSEVWSKSLQASTSQCFTVPRTGTDNFPPIFLGRTIEFISISSTTIFRFRAKITRRGETIVQPRMADSLSSRRNGDALKYSRSTRRWGTRVLENTLSRWRSPRNKLPENKWNPLRTETQIYPPPGCAPRACSDEITGGLRNRCL